MCNLVLVLLVALCSTSPVLGQNNSRKEEKGCTLPNRSRGVCKPSSECLHSGTNSTECSIERGIVHVCCEPTKAGSPSHFSTVRTTESPRQVELNGTSKTGNGTNDDKIADRFFLFDEPISADWQIKDDKRRVQHNYNHFREIDLDSFELVPADMYNLGGNKEEENINYEWENNKRRTERPYDPGYESYEKQGREKYPWENNQRTTARPYDPGYESYEKHGRKKYPWENNQRTTARPSTSILFNFEEEEDLEDPWNSNRRTTKRPYNPGFNYYEQGQQKNPWNSNRQTTERPYNPGFNYYEQEQQKNPWNSNRQTTERPYNPGFNYYEQGQQKNPWNSNRQTTERPYNPGFNYYEQGQQKNPWNSNRQTTERPYNPAPNYYEEMEDLEYPWNSNRRTTERPRTTRRTTVSPPKKQTLDPDGFLFSDNEKRKSISKIKCEEYSEIVTQTISGLPLIPDPSPIKIKVDECKNFQSLIVGGKNTSLGEFPHMAAIGVFDSVKREINWVCGGTLISDRYVLSAAHCAVSKSRKPVRIRLGDYNLKSDYDGAQPEEYAIEDIIVHPGYKQPVKYNDIALFRLAERVNLRKDIRPACLYTEFNIPHSTATAIGWGRVHRAGNLSDVLQKVSLDIIDNKSCRKPYNNTNGIKSASSLPEGIIESQLCAGYLSGGRDTCQGDSGGPLEILSDRNLCVHYVIGITSFGKSCASPGSPGVYTRVSSYIPWIESIVWPRL